MFGSNKCGPRVNDVKAQPRAFSLRVSGGAGSKRQRNLHPRIWQSLHCRFRARDSDGDEGPQPLREGGRGKMGGGERAVGQPLRQHTADTAHELGGDVSHFWYLPYVLS